MLVREQVVNLKWGARYARIVRKQEMLNRLIYYHNHANFVTAEEKYHIVEEVIKYVANVMAMDLSYIKKLKNNHL